MSVRSYKEYEELRFSPAPAKPSLRERARLMNARRLASKPLPRAVMPAVEPVPTAPVASVSREVAQEAEVRLRRRLLPSRPTRPQMPHPFRRHAKKPSTIAPGYQLASATRGKVDPKVAKAFGPPKLSSAVETITPRPSRADMRRATNAHYAARHQREAARTRMDAMAPVATEVGNLALRQNSSVAAPTTSRSARRRQQAREAQINVAAQLARSMAAVSTTPNVVPAAPRRNHLSNAYRNLIDKKDSLVASASESYRAHRRGIRRLGGVAMAAVTLGVTTAPASPNSTQSLRKPSAVSAPARPSTPEITTTSTTFAESVRRVLLEDAGPSSPVTIARGELTEQQARAQAERSRAEYEKAMAERARKISELTPGQSVGTMRMIQTGEDPTEPNAPKGRYELTHTIRVGNPQNVQGPLDDYTLDSGSADSLMKGVFEHTYEARTLNGIDTDQTAKKMPYIFTYHHLISIDDPDHPDQTEAFRWPNKTVIADPANDIRGDLMTITELNGTMLVFEAVRADVVPSYAVDPDAEHERIFTPGVVNGRPVAARVVNCAQTAEEYALAVADPTGHHEVSQRFVVDYALKATVPAFQAANYDAEAVFGPTDDMFKAIT